MRWDSDPVILLNDDIRAKADGMVACYLLSRTHIGLDFFDATISRTAAWVIGTRNMQKALLQALHLPLDRLRRDGRWRALIPAAHASRTTPQNDVRLESTRRPLAAF